MSPSRLTAAAAVAVATLALAITAASPVGVATASAPSSSAASSSAASSSAASSSAAPSLATAPQSTTALAQGSVAAAVSPPAVVTPYVRHRTERVCATSVKPGRMSCFAVRQTDTVQPTAFRTTSSKTRAVVPNAAPSGFSPANLRSAYALTTSGSATQTVAIIDAYDDPSAETDLGTYRAQYGLGACTTANGCFRKVNQNGAASPLPVPNSSWAGEISLDVDMVSAICPKCHILLVEADSASDAALFTGVDTAIRLGAKYVSNSYGGAESSSQTGTSGDAHFNRPGVAITASTGDVGTGAQYPATSQYVTAVGGTSLSAASNPRGWSESAWSGAGSGCSNYDAGPTWQTVSTGCAKRAEADVSAVADPNTGVAVYQSYGGPGWSVYGGTSAAAPIIASVYALAGTPNSADYPAAYPYAHPGSLNDITGGSNGSCGVPLCTAGAGWDGPSGLGTPLGTAAFTAAAPGSVTVYNPGARKATVGTPVTLTLTAGGGTTYAWSGTGLPPGLTIDSSTGAVSGMPTTSGNYSVTATATSGAGSGSTTFAITVSPMCATAQKLVNPGLESGSASWSATPAVIGQYGSSGQPAHGGTWDAWMDGYGTPHTDTLAQSVTIPTGCTGSTLSVYLHIATTETTTTAAFDKLTITIGTRTLSAYSNLNAGTGYTLRSFDVGTLAGQTVTVKFTAVEDDSNPTSFVVDDVALTTA